LKSLSKSWQSYPRVNAKLSSCVTGRNWTSLRRPESWVARRAAWRRTAPGQRMLWPRRWERAALPY